MSRIGYKPISIPDGVKVGISGRRVEVTGPMTKEPLVWSLPERITAALDEAGKAVTVTRSDDRKESRALHGLSRSLIQNMVTGAGVGYRKRMQIYGTGYGCNLKGEVLEINCGFMGRGTKEKPQFSIPVPRGLEIKVETAAARGNSEPATFLVTSADKQLIGDFCARVRSIRPPEPYKGKGIRYEGEAVQRKAGKAFAGGGG